MTTRILICGLNWLGDSIMAMPAIRQFRKHHPDSSISMLVKPKLLDLWRMNPDVNDLIPMPKGLLATLRIGRQLRYTGYSAAYILPNSLRSALPPWLAAIPARIGTRGHARSRLLTRMVTPPTDPSLVHQAWEYFAFLDLPARGPAPVIPHLQIPRDAIEYVRKLLGQPNAEWIAICPGAARGPSKQWPTESFAAVGSNLASNPNCRIAVFGGPGETEACFTTAAAIGPAAVNLAGRTSISQFAAGLSLCRLAITNDSGGMHLATATGTPVVAIFGITDPAKTGPLAKHHTILQATDVTKSRDIARNTHKAAIALKSITPNTVIQAANSLLANTST